MHYIDGTEAMVGDVVLSEKGNVGVVTKVQLLAIQIYTKHGYFFLPPLMLELVVRRGWVQMQPGAMRWEPTRH